MSRFAKPEADEWVQPIRKGYKLACCDCSLVHDMDFRVVKYGNGKHKVQFRVRRNNRSTAVMRRHMGLFKWRDGTWRTKKEATP